MKSRDEFCGGLSVRNQYLYLIGAERKKRENAQCNPLQRSSGGVE